MAHLILYDGICGLCNRVNRFVLARDRRDEFRFAPLQGVLARELLARHGRDAGALDTVYLVLDHGEPGERLLWKGRAALQVLERIGGPWACSRVLALLPTALLDAGYDVIARNRYRWFGRAESCALPDPRHRGKFLESDVGTPP